MTRLEEELEEYQVALLLYHWRWLCKIFETSSVTERTVNSVFEVLEPHGVGDTNIVFQRFKFNSRNQNSDEDFDTYLANLRQLAAKCNFRDLHDELIRDPVILGPQCEDTRRLLLTQDLTLEKAIPICRSEETATATIRDIQRQSTDVVHKINKTGKKWQLKIQDPNLMLKLFNANFAEESTSVRKSYAQPMKRNVRIVAKATILQSNVQRERRKQTKLMMTLIQLSQLVLPSGIPRYLLIL